MIKENVEKFEKVYIQILKMHDELSILSKKSPDGLMNKFKLKLINQLIKESNDLLEERYKPFENFIIFDEDELPTNSDVVLILAQYIECLAKYKSDNVTGSYSTWYWKLSDSKEQIKTGQPRFK